MRGVPATLIQLLAFNAVTIIVFTGVAYMIVKKARDPNYVPRDELERITLSSLKNPTKKEKYLFALLLIAAVIAPRITRYMFN
jgi:hypothetical protein